MPEGSSEWKAALATSAENFRELYEKYRSRGGGLFARYYEGRNYAVLGFAEKNPDERKKMIDKALVTLSDLRSLGGDAGFVPVLRAKAINTSLECWLDAKAYEKRTSVTSTISSSMPWPPSRPTRSTPIGSG